MLNNEVSGIMLTVLILIVAYHIFNRYIFPKIVEKTTKETEVNPKWITVELRQKYYGFSDIDFILAENPLGALPRFRASKDKTRLEMLISTDTTTRDVEDLGRVALIGKIQAKYGLFFPDKPIHWLSILCYMLDGGDINMIDQPVEKDKKPIDANQKI